MPIYEFRCPDCGNEQENLIRDGQVPSCGSCGSENLQKKLSVFAVGGSGGSEALHNCGADGGCCGGAAAAGGCGHNGGCGCSH